MRKISVYLPADLGDALAREAALRGISEAELIRAALAATLRRPRPRPGLFRAEPFAEPNDELLTDFGG
jgi:hypothetical protein